jgi:hypothetical protein
MEEEKVETISNSEEDCKEVRYNKEDRYIDPSSGRYSASRWNMVKGTVWSIVGSMFLIVGGFVFSMPQAFLPAATLLGVTITGNAAVYWKSTGKKFHHRGEEEC